MSATMFNKVKHRLGMPLPSSQLLQIANGAIIQSEARWEVNVEVNGVSVGVAFEVFNSAGKWDVLFGKTLLKAFKATHNYELDKVTIHRNGGKATLYNQYHITQAHPQPAPPFPICIVTDETHLEEEEKLSEINVEALLDNMSLFTRMDELHKPERV